MTTTSPTSTTAANTSSSSSTASSTSSATSQQSLNSDFQQFLTLLTTQLQNQDPTSPMDTNQVTQQIAMLSEVQQQINTNSNLQNLVSLFTSSQANTAASYIGKQVDATGNQIELNTDSSTTTKESSALVYNMPAGAATATVTIKDSKGNVVYSGSVPATSGRNQVVWTGTNSSTGATEPTGVYTFSVTGKDSNGKALSTSPTTFTTGIVTAVNTENGTNSLALGNISVPLNSVQSVYTAGTNPGTGA